MKKLWKHLDFAFELCFFPGRLGMVLCSGLEDATSGFNLTEEMFWLCVITGNLVVNVNITIHRNMRGPYFYF